MPISDERRSLAGPAAEADSTADADATAGPPVPALEGAQFSAAELLTNAVTDLELALAALQQPLDEDTHRRAAGRLEQAAIELRCSMRVRGWRL